MRGRGGSGDTQNIEMTFVYSTIGSYGIASLAVLLVTLVAEGYALYAVVRACIDRKIWMLLVCPVLFATLQLSLLIQSLRQSIRLATATRHAVENTGQLICPTAMTAPTTAPEHIPLTYSIPVAYYCADLIRRLDFNRPRSRFTKLTKLVDLYHDPTESIFGQVFQADDGHTLWICFRATQTANEWIQDFTYSQTVYGNSEAQTPFLISMQLDTQNLLSTTAVPPQAQVHTGFLRIYRKTRLHLLTVLQTTFSKARLKRKTVVVTGHSLGAAVSIICAVDLAMRWPALEVVTYTFGCPRIGNAEFCRLVDDKVTLFQVKNQDDIVAYMPPAVTPNLRDPMNPYLFSHCGESHVFTTNWNSLRANHSISCYMCYLHATRQQSQ